MAPTVEAPTTVRVSVLKSIQEEGHKYASGDQFDTPAERAVTLQGLGLVRLVVAEDARPRLVRAREVAHQANTESAERSRERSQVEASVRQAEEKLGALQQAMTTTTGIEAIRTAQRAVDAATRELEAQQSLLSNVVRLGREAAARAADAQKALTDLEGRAAWLKKAIPQQQANVTDHRRNHQKKLAEADAVLSSVRSAEAALSTLQAELASLGG